MDERIERSEGSACAPEPEDAPRWPLVAVAPRKQFFGVQIVADHWSKSNRKGVVEAGFRVVDVHTALHRTYTTDAHLATYVVRGRDGLPLGSQPRINKEGLQHMGHYGWTVDIQVLFCDIDNPGHSRWKDDDVRAAVNAYETTWERVEELASLGMYVTRGGYRVLHLLDRPVSPNEAESLLGVLHDRLERHGLAVDRKCKDWTRLFRLPNVKRDGRPERSRFLDLSRLRPVRLEAPAATLLLTTSGAAAPTSITAVPPSGRPAVRRRRPHVAPPPLRPLGPAWQPLIEGVAAAVRAEDGVWHDLFLALAGALLGLGVDPADVPGLCTAISLATGADGKTDDRLRGALSTVARAHAEQPVAGFVALFRRWTPVAFALDRALVALREPAPSAPAPALPTPPPTGPSREELSAQIEAAIRSAPPGLTVVHAACGLGKTRAAERVALERADKPYASPEARGERAPLGSKTVFSFDKNALSLESYARLRSVGAWAQRRFGPLSKVDAAGRPLCHFADVARPLIEGGQSLQREFCEGRAGRRCAYYNGCKARLRYEGERDARVVLGSHALLGELDEAAGKTGLLVIDEPPALVETVAFEAAQFVAALDLLATDFEKRFGAILRPLLVALIAYLEQAPQGEPAPMWAEEALLALAPHVPEHRLDTACRAADVERTPFEAYLAPAGEDGTLPARKGDINPFDPPSDGDINPFALSRDDDVPPREPGDEDVNPREPGDDDVNLREPGDEDDVERFEAAHDGDVDPFALARVGDVDPFGPAPDGEVDPFAPDTAAEPIDDARASVRHDGFVAPFAENVDAAELEAPAVPNESAIPPDVRARGIAFDLSRVLAVAIEKGRVSKAPPLLLSSVPQAMRRLTHANALGAASGVLGTLRRFFEGKTPGLVRVRWLQGKPRLLFTMPRADLADALTRDGAVVVLDANADVNLPLYDKILGDLPRYVRLPDPPDGAPIERRLVSVHATRTQWKKDGHFVPSPVLAAAVRDVVTWALESPAPGTLALLTYRPLRLALEAARRPEDPEPAKAWAKGGGDEATFRALVELFVPELARWPGELVFGHYGGLRGLDAMKDVDALATLGDPWPNVDDVETEVAFLRLPQGWKERALGLCQAELEQAHGRLRTVHRSKPGRAAHFGRVRPGGAAWAAVPESERPRGRPATKAALSTQAFRLLLGALGGTRGAARELGLPRSTVQGYANGRYLVPADVAERCRRVLAAKA